MSRSAPVLCLLTLAAALPIALPAQGGAKPAATPAAAVEQFMQAIADSNLTRMAQLFGTAKGPAPKIHLQEYQKRMVYMQAVLRGVKAHAQGDVPAGKDGMRAVTTQLEHNGCRVTIPVTTVHSKEGWLVHDFDLEQAGRINQPCEGSRRPGN